jgi:hypothetical protein
MGGDLLVVLLVILAVVFIWRGPKSYVSDRGPKTRSGASDTLRR